MNLEQLKYVVEIADTGSISAAAENLLVSQPNISQSIRSLEEELNIKIFTRSRQGSRPTESSEFFIQKARMILHQVNELKKIVQIQNSSLQGSLSVIAIPSFSLTILPKTLGAFNNRYSDVQIELSENGSMYATQCVLDEKADLALISIEKNTQSDPGISFEPLISSKTIAFVGKHSPLANKKEISIKEIFQYPVILLNKGYSTESFLRTLLEQYGVPNIMFSTGNSEIMRKTISESLAIGFFSDISLKLDPYVLNHQIVPLEISELKDVYTSLGIITKKDLSMSIITEKFIEELRIQVADFKSLYNLPD